MDPSGSSKVEVIATAIDGGSLLLETVPYGQQIKWPLENLPRPLPIGSRLTLELQKNGLDPAAQNVSIDTQNAEDTDHARRKLLEDLVN